MPGLNLLSLSFTIKHLYEPFGLNTTFLMAKQELFIFCLVFRAQQTPNYTSVDNLKVNVRSNKFRRKKKQNNKNVPHRPLR